MKKKTILWQSNYPAIKTGLGRNTKAILSYLYKTGKYEIVLYSIGTPFESEDYARFPYKIVGKLPITQQEIQEVNSRITQDPNYGRAVQYGSLYIDHCIKEYKPDVYVFSDDFWGMEGYYDKPWWNKTHCIAHITIDSLPIYVAAVKNANKIKHFFTWVDFAKNEFHKLGFNHVQRLHGVIDPESFSKLNTIKRSELRQRFDIPENAFIYGFVFRNQLRKEVGPLIEGFAKFKKTYPNIKNVFLLLHTHYNDIQGWDIPRFMKEFGVDNNDVLTTYVCRSCGDIDVKPFVGQDQDCRFCGAKGSGGDDATGKKPSGLVTCSTLSGCSEEQLNEVYNLMDAYVHLANSGGLEMPIVEALYAELPIATMNYAFGETFVGQPFTHTIEHTSYRQVDTHFKKANPNVNSVAKYLNKIYNTPKEEREKLGRAGRKWALSQFSPEVVGKQFEAYIDALPPVEWDFKFDDKLKNDKYPMPQHSDDIDFLKDMYKNILNMEVNHDDDGIRHWATRLKNGESRQAQYEYFLAQARKDNERTKGATLNDFLGKESPKDRILFNAPESLGDCVYFTCLLKDLRETYPDKVIYLATKPQFKEVFQHLVGRLIDKVIDWVPAFDNSMMMEGCGKVPGYFHVVYQPHFLTQRVIDYIHSGEDKTNIDFSYKVPAEIITLKGVCPCPTGEGK